MKSPAAQRPSGAGTPHEKVVGAQKRKSQKKRILSLPRVDTGLRSAYTENAAESPLARQRVTLSNFCSSNTA